MDTFTAYMVLTANTGGYDYVTPCKGLSPGWVPDFPIVMEM